MRAITVRRMTDHALICFGPENGMYDPSFNPAISVKGIELDYDVVLAEWLAKPPRTNAEKDAELEAFLDSAGGQIVKALATVLIQKGTLTVAELRTAYRNLVS